MSKSNKEMRRELGIGVVRFAEMAGVSSRTVRDVEREVNPREMRKATGLKFARAWAKFGVDPTEIAEVSKAIDVGPRYRRPDLGMSGVHEDKAFKTRIAALVEARMRELCEQLQKELEEYVEQEVERRVSERIAALEVQRK